MNEQIKRPDQPPRERGNSLSERVARHRVKFAREVFEGRVKSRIRGEICYSIHRS